MRIEKIISTMATTILLVVVALSAVTNAKAQPELKVTEIKFSNSNPVEGDEIWINATIWINITVNISTDIENIAVLFFCDDYLIGAENVNLTNLTNGTNTVGIRWKTVAWEHEIKVQLAIDEKPILNSTAVEKIYVQPEKIGSTINVIIALILICFAIVAVAATPSLREWFKWRKR